MSYYGGCFVYNRPNFLEACFRCRKPLGHNADIFMYRGNTPFCSEECRQIQIEMDEADDKSWKTASSSSRSFRKSDVKASPSNKTVRTGTVAVV
uniref:Senescence-associated family protein n=1 Tax=Rhizophora mucronata TaxID=61149 RepID=A0A2P2QR56_RHIMU